MRSWRWLGLIACVTSLCGTARPSEQPGARDGALPASPTLELIHHLPLPGPTADLWAHKNVVYVGTWYGAEEGVRLIDIADPARPTLIGSLPHRFDTTYEDIAVIAADTRAFKGDLLAVGLQNGTRGVEFWDVTDPRRPRLLSLWRSGGHGVHELHLLQRQGRVFALLACPGLGLQILDATNPTRPARLATWSLQQKLRVSPGQGASPETYMHSVSASPDGTIAYLSYWDAGTVILDISDPARPRYRGRTLYAPAEEANTHSSIEADGGRLLITTDEDIDPAPVASTIQVIAPGTLAGLHTGLELACTRPLIDSGPIRGDVVSVGRGLPRTGARTDLRGKIAFVDAGTGSQWETQVIRLQNAGAAAVLFSGPLARDSSPHPEITIPGMGLAKESGIAIKKALTARKRVEVELAAPPGTWGFVRLWDIRDRTNPVQVGTFATPATGQFPAPRPGWFTAHNPVVRGDRLYVSWYADGVRLVDIAEPSQPREIAHFVPPVIPDLSGDSSPPAGDEPYPDVWGVVEHHGLILLSDLRSGLWILRDLPR